MTPQVVKTISGILLICIGLALCAFGSTLIKFCFGVLSVFVFAVMIYFVLMVIFAKKVDTIFTYACGGVSLVLGIPLGYKAADLSEKFAISLFAGIICFFLMNLLCTVIGIADDHYLRDILELVCFFVGVLFGQKLEKQIKVVVVSFLGSNLSIFGLFLALRFQPIRN